MNTIAGLFGDAQQWLFEQAVQPLMFTTGLGNLLEEGYRATGWLLVGLLQIAVMLTLFAALERWRPVEAVSDRAAIRVDIVYTLLHRLGLFRVMLFFTLDPLWDTLVGEMRLAGLSPWAI
ncbi:MAG TPA: fatty acid hydroxylase, partial [Rubrivivax sp.]|nr:fatty acid hydroxylase [Rubrivivax sp.]